VRETDRVGKVIVFF